MFLSVQRIILLLTVPILVLVACAGSPVVEPLPATSTLEPTIVPSPTALPPGVFIDVSAEIAPINPLVYGTNYGPWLVVTVDVQDDFDESGLTFLRFPGGRWGDTRDIKEFNVDRLIDLAARIDAEITISVRLLGGTPEKAADLVRYTNIEKGYGIKYWSIGNEPSLYIDLQDAAEWDTEFYNEQWRIYAEAMLAVDPTIELLGPNIHQIAADPAGRTKDPSGRDWLAEFLEANGDLVDVVTFHRYPFPVSRSEPLPTLEMMRDNVTEWDSIIPAVRETIREITGEDKPIGVMEINSNYTNVSGFETSPDGFYNAIWWGDVLGRMITQRVDMVTHFALQHKTSGWGMLGRTEPKPTYYVYRMYQHFGETLLHSQSDEQMVQVLASRRDDGAVTVMLINRGLSESTVPFHIAGLDSQQASEVWRLEPEVWAENLGSTAIGDSLSLPAQSMTLLVFPERK